MRLVYLMFGRSGAFVRLVAQAPEGVSVCPEKGTWTFTAAKCPKTLPIGSARYIEDSYNGSPMIGVYDAENMKHLEALVHEVWSCAHLGRPSDD